MTDITPPPELVQQWMSEFYGSPATPGKLTLLIAARSAQWGADQELEACCEWLDNVGDLKQQLRTARRPKPSSKEQALAELAEWENVVDIAIDSPIRRALEALPDD